MLMKICAECVTSSSPHERDSNIFKEKVPVSGNTMRRKYAECELVASFCTFSSRIFSMVSSSSTVVSLSKLAFLTGEAEQKSPYQEIISTYLYDIN
jgi:hypothetical protein